MAHLSPFFLFCSAGFHSDVFLRLNGAHLGERPANRRYHRFVLTNSVIYNQLPWLEQEAVRRQFLRNFYHFFVRVIRSRYFRWDHYSQTFEEQNEDACVRLFTNALRGNFYKERMQQHPWLSGINRLGSLVHRDMESGTWSRVDEANARGIIAREGYVNLLVVPSDYNSVLDSQLVLQNLDPGALIREPIGTFGPDRQEAEG